MAKCKGQRVAKGESPGQRSGNHALKRSGFVYREHLLISFALMPMQCRLADSPGPGPKTPDLCKIKIDINESGEYLNITIQENCRVRFWFDDFLPNLAGLSEEYTGGKGVGSITAQPTESPPLLIYDRIKTISWAVNVRIVNFQMWSRESKSPGPQAPFPPVGSLTTMSYASQLGLGSKNSIVWQVIATDSDSARVTYSKVSFKASGECICGLAWSIGRALKVNVVHSEQAEE